MNNFCKRLRVALDLTISTGELPGGLGTHPIERQGLRALRPH